MKTNKNKHLSTLPGLLVLLGISPPVFGEAPPHEPAYQPDVLIFQVSADYFRIKADFSHIVAPYEPPLLAGARGNLPFAFDTTQFGDLTRSGDETGVTVNALHRSGLLFDISLRQGKQTSQLSGRLKGGFALDDEFDFDTKFEFDQKSLDVKVRFTVPRPQWAERLSLFAAAGIGFTEVILRDTTTVVGAVELEGGPTRGGLDSASELRFRSLQGNIGLVGILPFEYKRFGYGLRVEVYGGVGSQSVSGRLTSNVQFPQEEFDQFLRAREYTSLFFPVGEGSGQTGTVSIDRPSHYFYAESQLTLFADYALRTIGGGSNSYVFAEAGGKARAHFRGGDSTPFTGVFRGLFFKIGVGSSF